MRLSEVRSLLKENQIPFETEVVPGRLDYYRKKGFRPRREMGPFWLITVPNPNHCKNMELVFSDASDDPNLYDLEFGGYGYELFGCRGEELPCILEEEIHRILTGKANVIFASDAKTGRWFADRIYFDLPDPDMNDMDAYRRTLSRIGAPKSLLRKLIGRTDVYEIFNWFSYQKILK